MSHRPGPAPVPARCGRFRPVLPGVMVRVVAAEERPVVLMPTYNERDNVLAILNAALDALPGANVLVIDDGSPDGTAELALERSRKDRRIHVLQRLRKEGLGRAYLAGFRWALEHPAGYTHVFEMDADFSHDPRHLVELLQACRDGADLAVGSRYVPGGATPGWSPLRRWISAVGSAYARSVLSVSIRDLTTGFKCFRREVLETLPLDKVVTHGYGFQIELTYRALCHGFRVEEVPIVFVDRKHGQSKMSAAIMGEALVAVWRLRWEARRR